MAEVLIWSYFSIPTDLANEMRSWNEFASGEDYSVDLHSGVTGETVTVRLVEEWEDTYVLVNSSSEGELFDRVIGRVIYALSKNTDNLMIRSSKPISTEPTFKSD